MDMSGGTLTEDFSSVNITMGNLLLDSGDFITVALVENGAQDKEDKTASDTIASKVVRHRPIMPISEQRSSRTASTDRSRRCLYRSGRCS
jgi:hypothetical protein